MKRDNIIIGSRGSKLAIIYAEKVKNELSKFYSGKIEIRKIITTGDQNQNERLSSMGGKGMFSTDIEKELLENKIDIAVHALKDLPADETVNLKTDFFLERNDPREILISKNKLKLKDLKLNSTIGTSSFRREFQIKKIRNDLKCKLIRGNVDTRIKKLNDGIYDAIILSYAGIKSLMLKNVVTEIFSTKKIIPSAGQGIIALQCRKKDNRIISILKKINHVKTYARANAERGVLRVLQGDCQTAVGAHAVIKKNKISIEAELFSLDGKQRFYEKKNGNLNEFKELGKEVGILLKTKSNNSYKR